MSDVFISYSVKDEDVAQFLYAKLVEKGLTVFLASIGLKTGEQWSPQIVKALRASNCVCFLASKNALESDNVKLELGGAIFGKKSLVLDGDAATYYSSSENLADNAIGVGVSALGVVFRILTIGLFTFYLVADGPRFRRTICSFLRPDRQREVLANWEIAIQKTGGYLYSRLLLGIIQAVFHYVAFVVIGVALSAAEWRAPLSRKIVTGRQTFPVTPPFIIN